MGDRVVIPGLAAVREGERYSRELAFCEAPLTLCGMDVRHFSPRHLMHLSLVESPFAIGGPINPGDVVAFLFCVSWEYPHYKDRVTKHAETMDYPAWVQAIREYIDDAMGDAPGGGGSGQEKESIASEYAQIVHVLAKAYGWDDDVILDKPYSRIWQYVKLLTHEHSPHAPLSSRVHKFARQHLANQKETDA
jgi:hypothetical protein